MAATRTALGRSRTGGGEEEVRARDAGRGRVVCDESLGGRGAGAEVIAAQAPAGPARPSRSLLAATNPASAPSALGCAMIARLCLAP